MLKVKTIYDNREEFCVELRSGRHVQKRGSLGDPHIAKAPVCFLGLAVRIFGMDELYNLAVRVVGPRRADYRRGLAEKIGIPHRLIEELITKNDHNLNTFEDLADIVEAQL